MSGSLSLPDLKLVDRRVAATSGVWRKHVEGVEKIKDTTVRLADRRKHEATVYLKRTNRAMSRVRTARTLLATPLPAGMTPEQWDSVSTSQREAQGEMHNDCLRREEMMRRQRIAERDARVAADRIEALSYVKQEEAFRLHARHFQETEWALHKRELEALRGETVTRERMLAERAAEKAHREELRQRRQQNVAMAVAERRAHREALEKEKMETSKRERARTEERAERKARARAATRAYTERAQAVEYSKRLEKMWKHSESLLLRADDEYERHKLIIKGGSKEAPPAEVTAEVTADDASDDAAESWAQTELARLKARLEVARRRADAARDAYDKVRVNGMSPEEFEEHQMAMLP